MRKPSFLILGIGSFAHSTTQILSDNGASVATYLTRDYGHYPATLAGKAYDARRLKSPVALAKAADLVIPMSIDWAQSVWARKLLECGTPIFCPQGEALRIERDRAFSQALCRKHGIPFAQSVVAKTRAQAERLVGNKGWVIKNPLCSPTSPIHTILCESPEETHEWLKTLDYSEGVFLQEYMGRAEIGHIAIISGGKVHPIVTNQEYKRAFEGNMGVVAGAPMGGIVHADPADRYGLCEKLITPLLPWFKKVNYHGPLQVTAMKRGGKWHVVEYNTRIGVTSGAMFLRMLVDPVGLLLKAARNETLDVNFKRQIPLGVSVTLAGYGYPFAFVKPPELPISYSGPLHGKNFDLWWNQVELRENRGLVSFGHRLADVIGFGGSVKTAAREAYARIGKIRCLSSYFRADIGESLWPPGRGW